MTATMFACTKDWMPDSVCTICHKPIADNFEWLLLKTGEEVHYGCYTRKFIAELTAERDALAARVKELEQPARRCAKCGDTRFWVRWHWDQTYCPRDDREDYECVFADEHLHCVCPCGYEWSMPPLDAKE